MNSGYFEVHFLDVGQASASVVIYENQKRSREEGRAFNEAVIIDCGRSPAEIVDAVIRAYDLYVPALILTHNHADHAGGAPILLSNPAGRLGIGKVYLVKDDSSGTKTLKRFFKSEERQRRSHAVEYLVLESDGRAKELHRVSVKGADLVIDSLAPIPGEDFGAENPNQGSAVIRLRHRDFCVLFCGDSSVISWERIERQYGRINCDAVAVPHHGGRLRPLRVGKDAEWFFSRVVQAKKAVFSFSASNPYGHPRPEIVRAARNSGATVLCTQIMPSVHNSDHDLGGGVSTPTTFSLSGRRSDLKMKDGRRSHVACAGSITVYFGPSGAHWGNLGDEDGICGFESLHHLRGLKECRCPMQSACNCLDSTPQ